MNSVDAVVFDIDGVLVDDAASYRRAIRATLWAHYGETISPAAIQSFKAAGGFNNDWELTDAAALWVLARRRGYPAAVAAYTDAISDAGGGLAGATEVLRQSLTESAWAAVTAQWDPESIRCVFQHLYLGSDRYAAIEGPPVWTDLPGYIDDERVLVTEATLTTLRGAVELGVVTGRPAAEAAIALDRAGLSVPRDRQVTMNDPFPGKPDPAGLLAVCERLGAAHAVFVGDTRDDMEAARRADEMAAQRIDGIGVLTGGASGEAGRRTLEGAGASQVLDSVNELPRVLGITA